MSKYRDKSIGIQSSQRARGWVETCHFDIYYDTTQFEVSALQFVQRIYARTTFGTGDVTFIVGISAVRGPVGCQE